VYELWAPRSWRATLFALTGLAVVAATALLLGIWLADLLSLIDGSDPRAGINAFYVVVAVIAPVPLLWWLAALGSVHRLRFRTVLGIEIPAPPRPPGRWPVRLARAWLSPTAWRQLGYLLLSLVIGLFGGIAVAACWSAPLVAATYPGGLPGRTPAVLVLVAALFLAAPWVARAVTSVDVRAARRLLGPSPAQQLELRVQALARSRADVVAAADAERRRIERDLHDGAQQRLMSLAMNLGMARTALGDDVPPAARKAIEDAHDEAVEALAGLRELVRGLHPAVLNDRGLDAALSGVVARAALPVRLQVDVAPRCAPSIEAIAYFMVSEALTNIARHARASQAEIIVTRDRDRLHVVVTDDGCGGASPDGDGTGLRGLAQRAAAVDGILHVHSPAGGPTTITAELPCE
jgi:signal transduction histidine kinase